MGIVKKVFCLSITVALIGLVLPGSAIAQSTNNAAQGLQISPALVDLNAPKGESREIHLKVSNVTAADLKYTTAIDDFEAANETGSPKIIKDSKLPETASIRTWLSVESEFTLKSHESKDVKVIITVPKNAEPGGHYGILSFSGTTPEVQSTGVAVSASAGALLLVRVDGEITEKASLSSFFTATENSDKQNSFFENGPISFVVRIKNEGNIHVKPSGNIEVKDMFGRSVKTMPINDISSNILPKSIRKFTTKYDSDWMIGRYTATLTLGYGTTGQTVTNTIDYWVIPYKIILAILFVLATIIYILSRVIKAYNRRIFEKAKHEIASKNKHSNDKKGS